MELDGSGELGLENRRTGNRSVSSNLTHAAVSSGVSLGRATNEEWPLLLDST